MSRADAQRWDDRWSGRDAVEPSAPDAIDGRSDLLALLPSDGTALDVACGLGGQAVWLATRGLHVTAIDVSNEAVVATAELAADHGVADRMDASRFDLDVGLPPGADEFDVIVCQRFRDSSLYADFVERLRMGGILVLTVLSEFGAASPGPFHAPAGEVLAAFTRPDTTLLHYQQANGEESIVLRRRSPQ